MNKNDLKISAKNFVIEKEARFRDYYQIGALIGSGTFGEVRKWINKKTKAVRAVKIMRRSALTENEKTKFLQETAILRSLDHPNIIRVYEIYKDDKRYYIVTELWTGGELFDEIAKKESFSEKDAARILTQILEAISYCHAKEIVHRDLKPENILLDTIDSKTIKVIDFGTSTKKNTKIKFKQPFGTAYYMAPEVLKGKYDEKCDVWSIGVILYVLLSGKPPFDGENDKEICKKVKAGKYSMNDPIWKDVSTDAIHLIRQMLTYDPAKRISCKEALEHRWFAKQQLDVETHHTHEALQNLREFRAVKKLQQVAMTYIVSQLASKEEMDALQAAFKSLDISKSGMISKDELLIGYKSFMDQEMAEQEVERIMELADTDKSGKIDYTEWVVATVDKAKILWDEKIKQVFDLFDVDGNGFISSSEIKSLLGADK